MILKTATENKFGNRIEAGEQIVITSTRDYNEVFIMPLRATSDNSNPIGVWVNKEEVE